jgi:hypothetical protein
MIQQLIKHLEEVRPSPGEAKALVERMQKGTSSASDRQRLMEMLEAEEDALTCLASWRPPTPRSQKPRRDQRKKQMVKLSRRRNQR